MFFIKNKSFNPVVFLSSCLIILIVTVSSAVAPEALSGVFKVVQGWLIANTSWIYILSVAIMVFFCIWLIASRKGDIKLGPDHSEPEYSDTSWFAMLFSAGMGIGLLFFGVAEPLMHYSAPPAADPLSVEAAKDAMKITFFHWGLHAWAIYATLAVILAYFAYRKDLPLLPRSIFYPILGDKIHGRAGDFIDTFAVIGTMFGVASSLGYGVSQVNAGLNYLFGVPVNLYVQVGLIIGITAMATISVVLGLDGGIKKLSNVNLILAVLLLGLVLILGNSVDLLKAYVQNTGAYLSDFVHKTFNLYAYEKNESWLGGWTLLYWGWWVSWSPFVGMFIARISRGRTIREFIIGTLFIPASFAFLWFTVFGNTAIEIAGSAGGEEFIQVATENVPIALFKMFEYLPLTNILSVIGLLLVVTFFVSSSDSGSLVIDTLASGGKEHPPVWQRVFWAVLEGFVAIALLIAGGLDALQTMTIASAFPLMFLIIIGLIAFIKTLHQDYLLANSIQNHSTSVQYTLANVSWKERVKYLSRHPSQGRTLVFLEETVYPALMEFKEELMKHGSEVQVVISDLSVALKINNGDAVDFHYEVQVRDFAVPDYANKSREEYSRAEVFLLNGGQDYDVFGYSKEQIIADAITQYERHFHYLHVTTSEEVER
ncbi:BCCT family transporter [Aureibacter tunicatorum]|uniref:Choline/glycine/proline betaine transport protein n=1 Tax=Aureibacter tunicatorum TaxID=866807 RepID=A0AAE3XI17_9BACT|nr:BCCT family transporter [Aureibacter tunicatorum]MDR6237182.1 choline/glycine/proline betaine transport protein [Aureibacter tunicatorum]BDD06174.1 choline transporter [Aureibacter tunicatorum]